MVENEEQASKRADPEEHICFNCVLELKLITNQPSIDLVLQVYSRDRNWSQFSIANSVRLRETAPRPLRR